MSERGRPRSFDRDEALRRAMDLFWRNGFQGTSMGDLTEAMGIGSPSLYAAFGSKEALYREAMALYEACDGKELAQAVAEAPTARAAIEAFLMRSVAMFTRPGKPAGCMIVLAVVHAAGASEALRADLRGVRERAIASFAERLRKAVESGELPAATDTEMIASFYVTVQQGISLRARDGATRAELEAIAQAAMVAWSGLVLEPDDFRRDHRVIPSEI
jgi:AcrR family transcriptional regulator